MKPTSTPEQNAHFNRVIAEEKAREETKQGNGKGNNSGGDFRLDVPTYLGKYGIDSPGEKPNGDSIMYLLNECIFDSSHSGGEAAIVQASGGMLTYYCFHNSCRDRTWKEARVKISGSAQLDNANQSYHNSSSSHSSYKDSENQHWEDPEPLPDALAPVDTFDFNCLPSSISPWAEDTCNLIQCAPEYVVMAVMAGMGAVLGRKIGIRPQAKTGWVETGNQYALLIGRPGVMKSPAAEAALAPLKRMIKDQLEVFEAGEETHRAQVEVAKLRLEENRKIARKAIHDGHDERAASLLSMPIPEEPILKRYVVNDTSLASLAEIHRQNPNGLLVYRDELVSLLRSLDLEEQSGAKGFYLTGWNGNSPYTVDRIGRGFNLSIPAVCLSILGSTQPGKISRYIQQAVSGGEGDDGLLQRFGLVVWPDVTTWKDVDRIPDNEAYQNLCVVFNHLDTLSPYAVDAKEDESLPYLRFAPDALDIFRGWRSDLEHRILSKTLHPALESHFAKYRKLAPSLALLIHLADSGAGPVSKVALLKSLAMVGTLESHAVRMYQSAVLPDISTAKSILAKIIEGKLRESFSSKDVWRPQWSGLTNSKIVQAGLGVLVEYDWLGVTYEKTGGKTKTIYTINPKVKN